MTKRSVIWAPVAVAAAAWLGDMAYWRLTAGRHLSYLVRLDNETGLSPSEKSDCINMSREDRDLYAAWDYWSTIHPDRSICRSEVESAVREWDRVINECQPAADKILLGEHSGDNGEKLWLIFADEGERNVPMTYALAHEGFKRSVTALNVDAWRTAPASTRAALFEMTSNIRDTTGVAMSNRKAKELIGSQARLRADLEKLRQR